GGRLSILDHPIYAESAATRRAIGVEGAANDPRLPRILRAQAPHQTHLGDPRRRRLLREQAPPKSQLWVPVVAKGRMIGGFAVVWWTRSREFSSSDLALVEAIATQAGVAIENARLFDENRRRVEELSVLHELSRAVTGQL